jgi:hypothetical protein
MPRGLQRRDDLPHGQMVIGHLYEVHTTADSPTDGRGLGPYGDPPLLHMSRPESSSLTRAKILCLPNETYVCFCSS